MNPNQSHQSLPWASFNSFHLPPFSSFAGSSSFHPSRAHSETAELSETSRSPLPSDHQHSIHHESPRPPISLSPRSPTPISPVRPSPARSFVDPPTSPPVPSPSLRVPSPPPQTQRPPPRTPYPFLQTQTSPHHTPPPPYTTLENTLAGPFTRRYARPLPTPSSTSIRSDETKYLGAGTVSEPYLVDFSGPDDPSNPLSWNRPFKWVFTVHCALACLVAVFTSSSYVAGIESIQTHFKGTSTELAVGGVALYLLGQAFGPLIWAPLSEIIGRRLAFLYSFPLFVVFNLASAEANNMGTILVTRFFAGFFSSAELANLGGQMGDIWPIAERTVPAGLAALAPLLGPVLGPVISGFVAENAGFRAVFWLSFGWGLFHVITWLFFVPETYAPTLLSRKAAHLQNQADEAGTGEHFISKYDKTKKPVKDVLRVGLARPLQLLFTEVIVLCLCGYMAVIYGILYLLFTAFPVIFHQLRGWSLGVSGLALLGIGIGMILGFLAGGSAQRKRWMRARAQTPSHLSVPPEVRMPVMCVGAVLVPISLFGFAWTSGPNVHWIVPIIISVPFGMGYIVMFLAVFAYLIDSYTIHAASALAAFAVTRALFGAAFPMFATYMYINLGVHWSGTLLAFLSLACAPIPFLFYRYGHVLRRNSKYIPTNSLSKTQPIMTRPAIEESPVSAFDEKSRTRGSTPIATAVRPDPPLAPVRELSPVPGSRSRLGYTEVAGRERVGSVVSIPASRSNEGRRNGSIPGSRSRLGYAQVDEVDPDEREGRGRGNYGEAAEGVWDEGGLGYIEGVLRPLTDEEADVGMGPGSRRK